MHYLHNCETNELLKGCCVFGWPRLCMHAAVRMHFCLRAVHKYVCILLLVQIHGCKSMLMHDNG